MTETGHHEGYVVVGGGAIGGTLAVHLAKNDVPVRIVDSDAEHVEAINKHGLRIETPEGPSPLMSRPSHRNRAPMIWVPYCWQ